MDEREEFAFRPWDIAIDRFRQRVLGFAPLKRGKRPAGRENSFVPIRLVFHGGFGLVTP